MLEERYLGRAVSSQPPLLSLEKLAAMSAQLEMGVSRSAVLAEARISSRAFENAKAAWFQRMADEAMRGGRELHQRYSELVEASREEMSRRSSAGDARRSGDMPLSFQAHLSPLASEYRPGPILDSPAPSFSSGAVFNPTPPALQVSNVSVFANDDEGIDTVVLTEGEAQVARNPLPFVHALQSAAPSPSSDTPLDLDIARYAAIGAELAVFPDAAEQVLRRNGIADMAAWAQIVLVFAPRLRDPRSNAAWLEHYRFYHAHFLAEARKLGRSVG